MAGDQVHFWARMLQMLWLKGAPWRGRCVAAGDIQSMSTPEDRACSCASILAMVRKYASKSSRLCRAR